MNVYVLGKSLDGMNIGSLRIDVTHSKVAHEVQREFRWHFSDKNLRHIDDRSAVGTLAYHIEGAQHGA